MSTPNPYESMQIEDALKLFGEGDLSPAALDSLSKSQRQFFDTVNESLQEETNKIEKAIEKEQEIKNPASRSNLRAGLQNPMSVVHYLRGPRGRILIAAITKKINIAKKIEARQERQFQEKLANKKIIRNLIILAGLYRLAKRKAHAKAVNQMVNEEEQRLADVERQLDSDSGSLQSLFERETHFETQLAGIETAIEANDEQFELLQQELKQAEKLFADDANLHEETARLLNPNEDAAPEARQTHRDALRQRLQAHRDERAALSSNQPAAEGKKTPAQANLRAIQLREAESDLHLDLALLLEGSDELNLLHGQMIECHEARQSAEHEKANKLFAAIRQSFTDMGLIAEESPLKEEEMDRHCGHCELFDAESNVIAHHERSKATSFMRLSRSERLVQENGVSYLIPNDMSIEEFKTASKEQKAEYKSAADRRREPVASLRHCQGINQRMDANRLENGALQQKRADCQASLVAVRAEITKAAPAFEATIVVAVEKHQQVQQALEASAPQTAPSPKPTPIAHQFKEIIENKESTYEQKIQQLKEIMPAKQFEPFKREMDSVMLKRQPGINQDVSLLMNEGRDPDAFRQGMRNLLERPGHLFNEYRAVSGPYKEPEAHGEDLTDKRSRQLGEQYGEGTKPVQTGNSQPTSSPFSIPRPGATPTPKPE